VKGWLIVLLAVAPLAAGCGSEPSSFQGSGDALKDASSSRVEWRLEGKDVPDWALFRMTGTFDYAHDRGRLAFEGKSDSGQAIVVGRDSYLGAKFGDRVYWFKSSRGDATVANRFMPGPGGTTPDRLLDDLNEASTKVETLGSEEIRGVTTTHYRAQLDKKKLGIAGNSNEPGVVEAWIDEQGLPRRIRIPNDSENDSADVVDLFDFGVAVDVEAPPADDIVSEDAFTKLMEKACAKVKTAKDLEDANPLCLVFGATLEESGSDSIQVSPDRTFKPIEGK
jgi:hypothetical protein